LPFSFFNRRQDAFMVVNLLPNLIKYLAIMVTGACHPDMLRHWQRA
jgi:hypothetical protein